MSLMRTFSMMLGELDFVGTYVNPFYNNQLKLAIPSFVILSKYKDKFYFPLGFSSSRQRGLLVSIEESKFQQKKDERKVSNINSFLVFIYIGKIALNLSPKVRSQCCLFLIKILYLLKFISTLVLLVVFQYFFSTHQYFPELFNINRSEVNIVLLLYNNTRRTLAQSNPGGLRSGPQIPRILPPFST